MRQRTLQILVSKVHRLEDPLDGVCGIPELILVDDLLASKPHHLVVFLQEEIEHWENVLEY